MRKECLECGESIIGRIDKKFCSDLCRNSFNNKLNSVNSTYVRTVNTLLKRNRKILEELVPAQTRRTTKAKLLQKGFNFDYFTNVRQTRKGTHCFYCYEYGYLPLEKDTYILIKRKENAN